MINVTISHLAIEGHEPVTSRHRSEDPREAVDKAIAKAFGKRASLHEDSELSLPEKGIWYGQAIKPNGSCITGRIRVMAEKD